MSIIAVIGIPQRWSLLFVVKSLAKAVNGHFEALNFTSTGKNNVKTCYLRLSAKLDPVRVVERIDRYPFPGVHLTAFIPEHVPDLPLAKKGKALPRKLKRKLKIPDEIAPEAAILQSGVDIMTELQVKYTGLYAQSQKIGHKLLEEIARTVFYRLKKIMDANDEASENAFKLSRGYRKMHPHFGDFQLILKTLHRLQDAAGIPRVQISEKDLCAVTTGQTPGVIDNVPFEKVQTVCNKYSDRIIKKVTEHIQNLDTNITHSDTEEEIARKRVREELNKLVPFIPMIIRQVITKHFVPEKSILQRVYMYGEPFLPSKDTMSPFLKRYKVIRVQRSPRMYNLLKFDVMPAQYASIMAMDGTVISGAKLVIRPADMPIFKVISVLQREMESAFGGNYTGEQFFEDDDAEEMAWNDAAFNM